MNPSFATAFKSRLPLPLNNLSRHSCNVWKGLAVELMRLRAHFSRQTPCNPNTPAIGTWAMSDYLRHGPSGEAEGRETKATLPRQVRSCNITKVTVWLV